MHQPPRARYLVPRCGALAVAALLGGLPIAVESATSWYVAPSGNNGNSGASWANAKATIQAGVNQAASGDTVWVSNGVYSTGGRTANGHTLENRVAITNAITVRSVNGPAVTAIVGTKDAGGNGPAAVRCVYLGTNAVLNGFTLTNGATLTSGATSHDQGGGGVWCDDGAVVRRCIIAGNSAAYNAGGVNGGTLYSCALLGNTAAHAGGGATLSTLYNSTLVGNSAGSAAGGAHTCTLYNCIAYFNTAPSNPNYDSSSFYDSCTTPNPSGVSNITANPLLTSTSSYHLQAGSPCIDAGNNTYQSGTNDVDGVTRVLGGSIDMGAEETSARTLVNLVTNPVYGGSVSGGGYYFTGASATLTASAATYYRFVNWSDGVTNATRSVTLVATSVTYTANFTAASTFHYVSLTGSHVPPFSSWATAATNIQAAIDVCSSGNVVFVTNGTYSTGGRTLEGILTNRVTVDRPIYLVSVNGPSVTTILGRKDPTTTNGPASVRCVYLGTNATLSGFTLAGGSAGNGIYPVSSYSGGGLFCETNAVASNCVIVGNSSRSGGGCFLAGSSMLIWPGRGGFGARMYNCTIVSNLTSVVIGAGGGVLGGVLANCVIRDNAARGGGDYGGGASYSTIKNSTISYNYAGSYAGGTHRCILNNCTIMGNAAGYYAGGSYDDAAYNCIVYDNSAVFYDDNYSDSQFEYSCVTPAAPGAGNVEVAPALLSDQQLSPDSLCIGLGAAAYASGVDVDGDPWASPPSIGCDEPVPGPEAGPISVSVSASYTNVASGFSVRFAARVSGRVSQVVWNLGDGSFRTNTLSVTRSFALPGSYAVEARAFNDSNPAGVAATAAVQVAGQQVHYVRSGNAAAAYPYDTWPTAASNIQDAVDAASQVGALVWVSNGTYASGGRRVDTDTGDPTNRVVLERPVIVRSVNGPAVTGIGGRPDGLALTGVRGVLVGRDAALIGFSVTNGRGGARCLSGGQVSNCIFRWNDVDSAVRGGAAYNCYIVANTNGGATECRLVGCTIESNSASTGAGAARCDLERCYVRKNGTAMLGSGGGCYDCTLKSCLLLGNTALSGGGLYNCLAYNCTIVSNTATASGGGALGSTLYNSIVQFNGATTNANAENSSCQYCCVSPLPPSGVGNFTNGPGFAAAAAVDCDLAATAPCIDAGVAMPWMSGARDLSGDPRVQLGGVDVGAYEFRFEPQLVARLPGAFDSTSGLMHVGGVATSSPYAAARASLTNAFTNAVDWVEVSLRSTPTSPPAASVAAILLADGRIVMPDGGTNVLIEAAGNQYVVLRHRNHLAVMTAAAVLTNRYGSFDFSTNVLGVLGTANSLVPLGGGKWGLIPGDADGDGVIHEADDAVRRTQESP